MSWWHRWTTHDPVIAQLIKPPRVIYRGQDDSLRLRALARRAALPPRRLTVVPPELPAHARKVGRR